MFGNNSEAAIDRSTTATSSMLGQETSAGKIRRFAKPPSPQIASAILLLLPIYANLT